MKDAIIVSFPSEGTFLTKVYPYSEELFVSLLRPFLNGLLKVECKKVPAYLI